VSRAVRSACLAVDRAACWPRGPSPLGPHGAVACVGIGSLLGERPQPAGAAATSV
jgi:hypothetical protein